LLFSIGVDEVILPQPAALLSCGGLRMEYAFNRSSLSVGVGPLSMAEEFPADVAE
jgi:hypothetical protein